MKENPIYLKDGEGAKSYNRHGSIVYDIKDEYIKITIDSNDFIHTYNDEPGYIRKNGRNKESEQWFNHGYRHRLNGPAFIEYFNDHGLVEEFYFINGNLLTQQEFETEVNRISMLNEIPE